MKTLRDYINLIEANQQGVAEATGDKPFDNMMKTIKTGTKKQATADRREQKKQDQERTRAAISNMFGSSMDQLKNLKIKEQGVAEGEGDEAYVACIVDFNRSGQAMVRRSKPVNKAKAEEIIANAKAKNTFVHPPFMTIYPASAGKLDGETIMKQFPDMSQQGVAEVSKATLGRYIKANADDQVQHASSQSFKSGQAGDKYNKADAWDHRTKKREKGMDRAINKLSKEGRLHSREPS